jgi:DNA topoisomerase-2
VEVVSQLQKLGYPVMVDGDQLIPLERATKQQKDDGHYDYLIRMPIYSLTKEKVEELLQEKETKIKELTILKAKTDKDLWDADLGVFETEYKKHMDEFYDYMDINPKEIESKMAKPAPKKVVIKKRDSAATTPATSRLHTPINLPEVDDA